MELRFLPLLLELGMTGYAGESQTAKPITKTLRSPNLEEFVGRSQSASSVPIN
jgi:hypothetical protein